MHKENSPEQINPEGEQLEKRIIRKPSEFLREAGITDFSYEARDDGVYFFINLPSEHIEKRRQQLSRFLNAPDPTEFESGPVHNFTQRLNQTKDLAWEFRASEDDSIMIIVIFKYKKVKAPARVGGYTNPIRSRED